MSGRFETLSNQVQSRLETLERVSKEYGAMRDLDQKRQVVTRSKRDITTLQNNLMEMGRLIQTMPQRDREFFKTDLEQFQEQYDQIKQAFVGIDKQLQEDIKKAEEEGENGGLDAELLQKNKQGALNILGMMNNIQAVNKDTIKTQDHSKDTLAEDRALLNNVSNNLDAIDGEAAKGLARGSAMLRRGIMNGILSWALAIFFIAAFVVSFYWRFFGF
ncbi:hypothetical protein TRFO_20774 [Tritrichomonas foetus]|uniref:Vesicle transport v-SNARE N-terminal domain-containing protein n=1 Tax=Tritrichomonas foetus TaxID=1144522 RepID=A0A1J4KFA2_9EUKA|nr:hypothetical protein TRFO_20774 [Tritrichomonas foetus]|eukprot:OHT10119.1 hypothetical protein TRFO_20774 [Tritrichomonas foetus]